MDGSEGLDFDRFLKIVQGQKETNTAVVDDTDTVEAFVALGGKVKPCMWFTVSLHFAAEHVVVDMQADRSGKVLIDKLRATIKVC